MTDRNPILFFGLLIGIAAVASAVWFIIGYKSGGDHSHAAAPVDDWARAPGSYTCTEAQTAAVERDTEFCTKNTTYFSTYCYGTAIMRHCTSKAVKICNPCVCDDRPTWKHRPFGMVSGEMLWLDESGVVHRSDGGTL